MSNLKALTPEEIAAQKAELKAIKAAEKEELRAKIKAAKGPSRKEIKEMKKKQHAEIVASMSEVEYADLQLEKQRYFNNKLSYGLGYLGIVTSLTACFIALNTIDPIYFLNGVGGIIAILLNIVILLAGFLAAEKVKTYSEQYSIIQIVLGVISALRIFWYPLSTIVLYQNMMSDLKSGVDYSTIISNYSEKLGASFFKAVDANGIQLGASAYDSNGQVIYTATTFDHFATDGYLTANGTVRGIIMIVLLGISAAAFIASGVIGYIRAKRLHNYLNSKGQNN